MRGSLDSRGSLSRGRRHEDPCGRGAPRVHDPPLHDRRLEQGHRHIEGLPVPAHGNAGGAEAPPVLPCTDEPDGNLAVDHHPLGPLHGKVLQDEGPVGAGHRPRQESGIRSGGRVGHDHGRFEGEEGDGGAGHRITGRLLHHLPEDPEAAEEDEVEAGDPSRPEGREEAEIGEVPEEKRGEPIGPHVEDRGQRPPNADARVRREPREAIPAIGAGEGLGPGPDPRGEDAGEPEAGALHGPSIAVANGSLEDGFAGEDQAQILAGPRRAGHTRGESRGAHADADEGNPLLQRQREPSPGVRRHGGPRAGVDTDGVEGDAGDALALPLGDRDHGGPGDARTFGIDDEAHDPRPRGRRTGGGRRKVHPLRVHRGRRRRGAGGGRRRCAAPAISPHGPHLPEEQPGGEPQNDDDTGRDGLLRHEDTSENDRRPGSRHRHRRPGSPQKREQEEAPLLPVPSALPVEALPQERDTPPDPGPHGLDGDAPTRGDVPRAEVLEETEQDGLPVGLRKVEYRMDESIEGLGARDEVGGGILHAIGTGGGHLVAAAGGVGAEAIHGGEPQEGAQPGPGRPGGLRRRVLQGTEPDLLLRVPRVGVGPDECAGEACHPLAMDQEVLDAKAVHVAFPRHGCMPDAECEPVQAAGSTRFRVPGRGLRETPPAPSPAFTDPARTPGRTARGAAAPSASDGRVRAPPRGRGPTRTTSWPPAAAPRGRRCSRGGARPRSA